LLVEEKLEQLNAIALRAIPLDGTTLETLKRVRALSLAVTGHNILTGKTQEFSRYPDHQRNLGA